MAKQPAPIPPEGTPPLTEGYLTAKEAAERMGLSVETVRAMCGDGVLPGATRNHEKGSWRIPVDAVEAWLAQQNNTPQPKAEPTSAALPPTRFWRLVIMIGAIVGILGLVSVIANSLNIADRWRVAHATPTPLPFERAKADETLILIASFDHTANVTDTDIEHEIQRAIRQAADELQTPNLRVEVEPTHLKADDQSEANALGKHYDASMVIWGADTGVRVTASFLNLKEPDLDIAATQITETERVQIAKDPDPYVAFVTGDLPGQVTFLALYAIGQSYSLQGAYTESISAIEKGIAALAPDSAPPQGLANAYFQLGWLYQTTKDYQQAIERYTRAIALDPQAASAYYNRGNARKAQGDLAAAIQDYDQAIALDPQDASAYYNRGNTRKAQGDLAAAIQDYDQAIALDPQDASAYYNRGLARYAQGDLAAAIQDYDQAIALDPQDASAYYNRGLARYAQGDLAAVIQDYDQAIALDPQAAWAYYNRGNARKAQGDLAAAIQDYDQAIALDPQAAWAYYNRGNTRKAQGDLAAAIQDYDQAIALDPQDAWAYYNRGLARKAQGDLAAAIQDFDQAIALDPQDASAYYNRGLVRKAQGDLAAAIQDFDQAIAFDPQDASAYYNRGLVRKAQGDLATAIQDFDQAIAFDPQDAWAYYNRGLAHKAQGHLAGAITDFRRYLELKPNATDRQQVEGWIAELEQQLNKP